MYDDPENAPIIIAIFSTHVFINASNDGMNTSGYDRSPVCKRYLDTHPIRSVSYPSRIIIENPPIVQKVMIKYDQYELRKIPPMNEYIAYAVPYLTYRPSYAMPINRDHQGPRGMQKPIPVPDYESAINEIIEEEAVPVGHTDLENIYFAVLNGKEKKDILNMTFEDALIQLVIKSMKDGDNKDKQTKSGRKNYEPDIDEIRRQIRPDDVRRYQRRDRPTIDNEDDDDDDEI